jgi:hypothetical protein
MENGRTKTQEEMAREFNKHLYKGEREGKPQGKKKAKRIERRELWEVINQSPKEATAGTDGVNMELLKEIGRCIPETLCRIYDQIIEKGKHLDCWKEVVIVTIKIANKLRGDTPKA